MSCTGFGFIHPQSLDEVLGLRESGERGGAPPLWEGLSVSIALGPQNREPRFRTAVGEVCLCACQAVACGSPARARQTDQAGRVVRVGRRP